MYIVIIEWDGKKPPTTWYNRLRKRGIHIGVGDKNVAPMERRSFSSDDSFYWSDYSKRSYYSSGVAIQDYSYPRYYQRESEENVDEIQGTVAQEGMIISVSESFSHYLASLAMSLGAVSVSIVEGAVVEYKETEQDRGIFERIESANSKRGKKRRDTVTDWVITCLEEGVSHEINGNSSPMSCPTCGATKVNARPGVLISTGFDTSLDNYTNWFNTRFVAGLFETSPYTEVEPGRMKSTRLPTDKLVQKNERDAVKIMDVSTAFIVSVNKVETFAVAARILDTVFISRAYTEENKRSERRLDFVMAAYKRGVSPSTISMFPKPDCVDVGDTAIAGVEFALTAFAVLGSNRD